MRYIQLVILFVFPSIVNTMISFRYRTCIREHQSILNGERAKSIKQAMHVFRGYTQFANDQSKDKYRVENLDSRQIITHARTNLSVEIDFWRIQAKFITPSGAAIVYKPNLDMFARAYFICGPGHDIFVLLIWGPVITLNSDTKVNYDDLDEETRLQLENTAKQVQMMSVANMGFAIAILVNSIIFIGFVFGYPLKKSHAKNPPSGAPVKSKTEPSPKSNTPDAKKSEAKKSEEKKAK